VFRFVIRNYRRREKMRRILVSTGLYIICGFLLATTIEAAEKQSGIEGDQASRILVTSKVVEALGKIGNPQARDVLIKALNSKEFFIRAYAAQALGRIQDKESIPLLKKLTDDKNYLVRILSAVALVRLGQKDMEELLFTCLEDEDATVRAIAAREVGGLGYKFLHTLTGMLSTEKDYLVRINIIEELGQRGYNPALSYIRGALEDENPQVRVSACSALGKLEDKQSIPQLLQRLDDENLLVRAEAEVVLADLMLPDPEVVVASLKAEGIEDIPKVNIFEVFQNGVNMQEPVLMASSYVALAIQGQVGILPILLKQINAPETLTIVRGKVAEALRILKPQIIELAKDTFGKKNLKNISLWDNFEFEYQIDGNNLILIFTQALLDSKSPLYRDAPLVLKELDNKMALPALRETLLKDDSDLIATTAYVLGELRDQESFDYLIKVFEKYGI
jgi:HEAT repeat protein